MAEQTEPTNAARVARGAAAGGAILSLGAALVGPVAPAGAATFTVTNTNDAGPGSLRQAVLDANGSAGPDTISIATTGTITLTSGEIDVTDEATIAGPGAASLTISGNNASRIFYVTDAVAVTISGVTVTDGQSGDSRGGGIASVDTDLTVQASVVTGNEGGNGGGIAARGGDLVLSGTTVSDNDGGSGGGVYAGYVGSVSITDSSFTGNYSDGDDGGGLGVEHASGAVSIVRSTFDGNHASSDGGGMNLYEVQGDITITDAVVTDNEAPGDQAGGIFLYNLEGSDVTITGTTISGNIARHGGGINFYESPDSTLTIVGSTISGNESTESGGGGLRVYYSGDTAIEGSTFDDNHATYDSEGTADGGSIYVAYDGGGTNPGNLSISTSTISNSSATGAGGGVFANVEVFTLDRSTVAGNDATYGGGLHVEADTTTISSSTISGNTASGTGGGALVDGDGGATTVVEHSTIAGNDASYGGGLALVYGGEFTVDHVILTNNTADEGPEIIGLAAETGVPVTIANSLVEGATQNLDITNGGGNITGQDGGLLPLAANGGPTQTHALADTSPALDGGDPAFTPPPSTDQRGLARVQGEAIDIGAYETQDEVPPPPPGEAPAARAVTASPTFTG